MWHHVRQQRWIEDGWLTTAEVQEYLRFGLSYKGQWAEKMINGLTNIVKTKKKER